ncbi:lipoprotein [Massilia sp. ZL223]|uniref:LPS translocon maturation chaperone LptM n=1 Tax=Massilia sp. ZL223 TaxID=2824904 RepID=UPI001B81CD28|nr:lipoprotein [Massilia sp. ZL223]MBQ5961828.1 lipoprotein [Massilia sp. ZL223]
MKSSIALPTAAVLLAASLSGCGQTGPLYLPNPPARPAPAPVEQPAQPVPSNNASVPAPTK